MATQVCLIGVNDWTVDAITRIPIYAKYAWRPGGEGKIVNTGGVTIDIYDSLTGSKFYQLVVGGELPFKTKEIRGTVFAGGQNGAPICYAIAETGTGTLKVVEG